MLLRLAARSLPRAALPWAILCLVVCVQTYPLVLHLSSGIYGYAGDSLATIMHFSQLAESVLSPSSWHAFRYSRPATDVVGALLTVAGGPIVAYNVLVLSGYVASAVATYLLAKHVTRNRSGAMLAAFAFTFCPYRLMHSYGHLHLSLTQWIPLYVLCLLRLRERAGAWRAVQLALVLFLLSLSSFYYSYLAALFFLPVTAILLLRPAPGARRYIMYALAALAPCVVGATILFRNRVVGVFTPDTPNQKLLYDLFAYSARPLEYVIPHASSLWRSAVLPFWRENLHASNEVEQALFLGAVPLALSAVAVAATARRHIVTWPVALALTIVLSAIALSAPPAFTIAGLQIPGPCLLLARLFPAFRAYARMGIMAYLGVALFAALGWRVLAKRLTGRARAVVWGTLVIVIVLEYTNVPPFRFVSLDPPPVHEWLRSVKEDVSVVEFPLPPEPRNLAGRRVYFSLYHGKKSRVHLWGLELASVRVLDRATVDAMSSQGVGYVIIHSEPLDAPRDILIDGAEVAPPPPIPRIDSESGLRLVHQIEGALVYRVDAVSPPSKEQQSGT